MNLMERIQVRPFHKLDVVTQSRMVEEIRRKRESGLEKARTTKGKGMTKSAAKNIAKRTKKKANGKATNPEKKATAALAKLSPEEFEKIKNLL